MIYNVTVVLVLTLKPLCVVNWFWRTCFPVNCGMINFVTWYQGCHQICRVYLLEMGILTLFIHLENHTPRHLLSIWGHPTLIITEPYQPATCWLPKLQHSTLRQNNLYSYFFLVARSKSSKSSWLGLRRYNYDWMAVWPQKAVSIVHGGVWGWWWSQASSLSSFIIQSKINQNTQIAAFYHYFQLITEQNLQVLNLERLLQLFSHRSVW